MKNKEVYQKRVIRNIPSAIIDIDFIPIISSDDIEEGVELNFLFDDNNPEFSTHIDIIIKDIRLNEVKKIRHDIKFNFILKDELLINGFIQTIPVNHFCINDNGGEPIHHFLPLENFTIPKNSNVYKHINNNIDFLFPKDNQLFIYVDTSIFNAQNDFNFINSLGFDNYNLNKFINKFENSISIEVIALGEFNENVFVVDKINKSRLDLINSDKKIVIDLLSLIKKDLLKFIQFNNTQNNFIYTFIAPNDLDNKANNFVHIIRNKKWD